MEITEIIQYFRNIYDLIHRFLFSEEFATSLLFVKLASYLFSFFLIFLIVVLLKKVNAAWWVKERIYAWEFAQGSGPDKKWQGILERLHRGDEANIKLAVIEADNLFDSILQRMGLPGKNMDERLKAFESHELKSLSLVLEAHALRNQIVHQPGFQLAQDQAAEAIEKFGAALKELEYLS